MPARITVKAELASLLAKAQATTDANRAAQRRAEADRQADRKGLEAKKANEDATRTKPLEDPVTRTNKTAAMGNRPITVGKVYIRVSVDTTAEPLRNAVHTFYSGDSSQSLDIAIRPGNVFSTASNPDPLDRRFMWRGAMHDLILPLGGGDCIALHVEQSRYYLSGYRERFLVAGGGPWIDPILIRDEKVSYAVRIGNRTVRQIAVPEWLAAADLCTFETVDLQINPNNPGPGTINPWQRNYEPVYTTNALMPGCSNYPQFKVVHPVKGRVNGRQFTPAVYFLFGDGDSRFWANRTVPADPQSFGFGPYDRDTWPLSANLRAAITEAGIAPAVKSVLWIDNELENIDVFNPGDPANFRPAFPVTTERLGFVYDGPESTRAPGWWFDTNRYGYQGNGAWWETRRELNATSEPTDGGAPFDEITVTEDNSTIRPVKKVPQNSIRPLWSLVSGRTFLFSPLYFTDWRRPDFCRRRALELGFTSADLAPLPPP
jgi:hypothetical protein